MKCARFVSLFSAGACVVLLTGAQAADLKSPEKVQQALRILAYVQADMASKLPNKAYDRLPHENMEFQEAAPALRNAIAGESSTFQEKVEVQLKRAQVKANEVAEVSQTKDEGKITAAVAAVAAALKPLNELFPEALRPVPGQLGTGPGRRGQSAPGGASGPPPDLR